jgi:predicted N-acetyltransferase YhbS
MEPVEFDLLTDDKRAELEGDEEDPWDGAGSPLEWRPKEHHVALQDDNGRLVASAGVLMVDVEAGGERFPVVGLGGVIVNAGYRGRGLSLRVIEAALAKAGTLGPDRVILFCHEDRAELYRRFGFQDVTSTVLVEHRGGHAEMPMRTMWRALRPDAGWPGGTVVVHSLPF